MNKRPTKVIAWFEDISKADISIAGDKGSNLGEMVIHAATPQDMGDETMIEEQYKCPQDIEWAKERWSVRTVRGWRGERAHYRNEARSPQWQADPRKPQHNGLDCLRRGQN